LELRYRLEDGYRMGQLFARPTGYARSTRALALGARTEVYVGCAPRTRRHGGRDAVRRAFMLWVDCDGEDAASRLERFEPAPSIVIASGTRCNCHAYWPLSRPVLRDEDLAPPGLMHAVRDHQRLVDHAAAVAHLLDLGIEEQVRVAALQRSGPERLHVLVERLTDAADLAGRDAQTERLHELVDAPRRNAADTGLLDNGQKRLLRAAARLQKLGK